MPAGKHPRGLIINLHKNQPTKSNVCVSAQTNKPISLEFFPRTRRISYNFQFFNRLAFSHHFFLTCFSQLAAIKATTEIQNPNAHTHTQKKYYKINYT